MQENSTCKKLNIHKGQPTNSQKPRHRNGMDTNRYKKLRKLSNNIQKRNCLMPLPISCLYAISIASNTDTTVPNISNLKN